MRSFSTFTYKDASYRISPGKQDSEKSEVFDRITEHIRDIRNSLENYIKLQPEFLTSLEPVELLENAPEAAVRMADAAKATGLGPMSAVAGITAELAARRTAEGLTEGLKPEIIIENGGDIFILPGYGQKKDIKPVTAGLFSGINPKFDSLALKITPPPTGIAICSSSSRMGHSLSLGNCDLATITAYDAALADAAATLGGNLVKTERDLKPSAEYISAIPGVAGVILIKNQQIAIAGRIPELVRHNDEEGLQKITGFFLK